MTRTYYESTYLQSKRNTVLPFRYDLETGPMSLRTAESLL